MVTQMRLLELFEYRDGVLYWKRSKGAVRGGKPAGNPRPGRYVQVSVDSKRYYLHRLVFLFHNGTLPDEIDHIDRSLSNNRIENLRAATRQQNAANKAHRGTGYKGVKWVHRYQKYKAGIMVGGKGISLGLHDSEELAARLYDIAAKHHFKEFAVLNFPEEK